LQFPVILNAPGYKVVKYAKSAMTVFSPPLSCASEPSNPQDAIDHFNPKRLSDVSVNSQIIQSVFYGRWIFFRHDEYTGSRIIVFCEVYKLKVMHDGDVKGSHQNVH
jgi:hypothetical protein